MIAGFVVRVAVRLLPAGMRDRYREQWGADLRDAAEAGLSRSGIAIGALSFAARAERVAVTVSGSVGKRARLASALALSTAIVVVTQYASIVNFSALTGNGLYDFVLQFFTPLLLLAYLVLAPLVAIVLVSTRGMYAAVRVAVWLLVIASLASIARTLIDSGAGSINNVYFTAGTASYAVAAVVALVATGILARHFRWFTRQPGSRKPLAAIASASVVWGVACLGLAAALALVETIRASSPDFVNDVAEVSASQGALLADEVARMLNSARNAIFVWFGFAVIVGVLVLATALVSRSGAGRSAIHSLAGVCVVAIAFVGVTTFVKLTSVGGIGANYAVPEEVLLIAARWTLIAILLFTVGGVRFASAKVAQPAATNS